MASSNNGAGGGTKGAPLGTSLRALWAEDDAKVDRSTKDVASPQNGSSSSIGQPQLSPSSGNGSGGVGAVTGRVATSPYEQEPVGSPSTSRSSHLVSPMRERAAYAATSRRFSPELGFHQTGQAATMPSLSGAGNAGSQAAAQGMPGHGIDYAAPYESHLPASSSAALARANTTAYHHATLPRQHLRENSTTVYGGNFASADGTTISAEGPLLGSAALGGDALDNQDDRLFFQRDAANAPRRNHTIATASRGHQKRLDQHFLQPSPSKNSLSAITGGRDPEEDEDWDAILRRRHSLLSSSTDDELEEPRLAARVSDLASSSHRRYPSQPVSTMATSPLLNSDFPLGGRTLPSAHHRSESAHLTGLDQGPFASSPLVLGSAFGQSSGMLRRHQSLNHHTGRQSARSLALDNGTKTGESVTQLDPSLSPVGHKAYGNTLHSPVKMMQTASGSSFQDFGARNGTSSPADARQQAQLQDSDTRLTPSLMDAHARLSRMSIQPANTNVSGTFSRAPIREDSLESRDAVNDGRKHLPSLITNQDVLARGATDRGLGAAGGPASAAAYVPPIGHAHHRREKTSPAASSSLLTRDAPDATKSAFPALHEWNAKEAIAGRHPSAVLDPLYTGYRPHLPVGFSATDASQQQDAPLDHIDLHHKQQLLQQQQLLFQQQQQYHLQQLHQLQQLQQAQTFGHSSPQLGQQTVHGAGALMSFPSQNVPMRFGPSANNMQQVPAASTPPWKTGSANAGIPKQSAVRPPPADMKGGPTQNAVSSLPPGQARRLTHPQGIDSATQELIAAKGLNPLPTVFNANAPNARFFVIKSYTEDDVYRSLKHGIWASTEKGNQRLDRAFKESSNNGPLYLLFSVNGSGHFCGVARMLTAVDYSANANVWALEGKWKGIFSVKWIYVKDVPNNALRHIRLTSAYGAGLGK